MTMEYPRPVETMLINSLLRWNYKILYWLNLKYFWYLDSVCFHKQFFSSYSFYIIWLFVWSQEQTFHQNIYFPYFHGSKTGKLSKSDLQVEKRDPNDNQTDKVGNKESPWNRFIIKSNSQKYITSHEILTACLYKWLLILLVTIW